MKVVHIITRLILGGAQENTLLSVEDQHYLWHDEVALITGKQPVNVRVTEKDASIAAPDQVYVPAGT